MSKILPWLRKYSGGGDSEMKSTESVCVRPSSWRIRGGNFLWAKPRSDGNINRYDLSQLYHPKLMRIIHQNFRKFHQNQFIIGKVDRARLITRKWH